ncbi:MAG: helix-turn-helix transcriptional regulator, partial [Bacteroidota bacterium]
RTHDIDVKIEEGRFIAERIKGAKFVELEGDDHLFWAGDMKRVLQEMRDFIQHTRPIRNYGERLFTFVAARMIPTGTDHVSPKERIGQFVAQYRGNIVQIHDHGFIATFEGPSKAAHCSIALVDALKSLQTQLSVGIHIKEATVDAVLSLNSEIQKFLDAILEWTEPNQILITQSVKNLLSGAGLQFSHHKNIASTGLGDSISLHLVSDPSASHPIAEPAIQSHLLKNDSFLENVLQCIDKHLSEESFGVEMLCKEIGMSERQLQRKLKAITNKSPIQLISSVRLHRAKELILNRKYNITEVSFQTGFSSPSYFSHCFKKEFGLTPSALSQGR